MISRPRVPIVAPPSFACSSFSWEPWTGSQTLPRRFAAGKAGRLRTRRLSTVQLFQERMHVFAAAAEKDAANLRCQSSQRRSRLGDLFKKLFRLLALAGFVAVRALLVRRDIGGLQHECFERHKTAHAIGF